MTLIFDIGGEALRRNITANIKCAKAHLMYDIRTRHAFYCRRNSVADSPWAAVDLAMRCKAGQFKQKRSLVADFRRDVQESYIRSAFPEVLDILLKDRTTGKNILWCTKDYEARGAGFGEGDEIRAELISDPNDKVIVPRACKNAEEQKRRVQEKGEVFTPAWVCNAQNNLVDNAWFGRKNAGFNCETLRGWTTIYKPIKFTQKRSWQEYVTETRLEITCGEAPYLASRYDMAATTDLDAVIPVSDRIGLLDRKLRVVSEHCDDVREWTKWAERALQSVLGFDWQGDNVFLARENLLWTMLETAAEMMNIKRFSERQILRFAEIISWNIWQMDGLKFVVPNTCKPTPIVPPKAQVVQDVFFAVAEQKKTKQPLLEKPCPGCAMRNPIDGAHLHNGIYCQIMNWETGEAYPFVDHVSEKEP